jgi:zinc protease
MRLTAVAVIVAAAWGGVSGFSMAQTPSAGNPSAIAMAQRVTQVEGITEYRLPNGLRVLLAPDASKPTTTVNITYLVGSRHENYGETGMAHLLEHMLFKGTARSGNLMQALDKRGMNFNGTTFYDRTNYYETFPAQEDHLQWALEMEADRMVNSLIDRKDLDTEFSVVRNGWRQARTVPRKRFGSGWRLPPLTGTTTAKAPSAREPMSRMSRSKIYVPFTASTTNPTMPC